MFRDHTCRQPSVRPIPSRLPTGRSLGSVRSGRQPSAVTSVNLSLARLLSVRYYTSQLQPPHAATEPILHFRLETTLRRPPVAMVKASAAWLEIWRPPQDYHMAPTPVFLRAFNRRGAVVIARKPAILNGRLLAALLVSLLELHRCDARFRYQGHS